MKTILVLAQHPDLPEAVRHAVNAETYRVVERVGVVEAEPFLHERLIQICILDGDLAGVQPIWCIEKIRRQLPNCPIIIFTSAKQWEWEEEAYLHDVSHIFTKPLRPRLLAMVLDRLAAAPAKSPPPAPARAPRREPVSEGESNHRELQALGVLRNLSAILTHSLCADGLLKSFLLLLREILGINRAFVFLRRPSATFGGVGVEEARCLRPVCAIGLPAGLMEHFELSTESGMGFYLFRQGRILRRNSDVGQSDVEIQKEFEVMGTEVAIPILDRETFIGVAAFDGRVTGEALSNSELELIFHLLEEVGLAVKNIWLHDQLAANHEIMTEVFSQLSSACVVVNKDLTVVHSNKAARSFFARPARRQREMEFTDLPQLLASKVYQVLKTGVAIHTFKYQPPDSSGSIYQVTILPFQKQDAALPYSALLVAEDHTQSDRVQQLEREAANLRLVRTMADRLAHEIGNALVPISTYQQLLSAKFQDPEFRHSMNYSVSESVKRISRLTDQMRFLARDTLGSKEAFPLEPLIEEAFEEAKKYQPAGASRLTCESDVHTMVLAGDRAALKHVMKEVLINALQANPTEAHIGIGVRTQTQSAESGIRGISIEVHDNGPGFAPEVLDRGPEPFSPRARSV